MKYKWLAELDKVIYSKVRREYFQSRRDKMTKKKDEMEEKMEASGVEALNQSQGEIRESVDTEVKNATVDTTKTLKERKLEALQSKMNESMNNRLESDIPLNDDYWKYKNALQQESVSD